jgi:hypothetical protein
MWLWFSAHVGGEGWREGWREGGREGLLARSKLLALQHS